MDNIPFKNNDIMNLNGKFGGDDGKKNKKKKWEEVYYTPSPGKTYLDAKSKTTPRKDVLKASDERYGTVYKKTRYDKHGGVISDKDVITDPSGNKTIVKSNRKKIKVIEKDPSGKVISKRFI